MNDLLLALLATTVMTTVALLALSGLTVVPFVLALRLAQTRRLSVGRVGAMATGGIVLALALSGGTLLAGGPAALVLPALLLAYAVPAVLRVTRGTAVAGTAGRHE